MKNTRENNKLIEDFLKSKVSPFKKHILNKDYHNSWDLLMPVVEKIESMYDIDKNKFFVEISTGCSIFSIKRESFFEDESTICLTRYADTKLEATHCAIIEFIKWYNKNKTD